MIAVRELLEDYVQTGLQPWYVVEAFSGQLQELFDLSDDMTAFRDTYERGRSA